MIKTNYGCPVCGTPYVNGSGSTGESKLHCSCENGHDWYEYTAIEIINGSGGQTDEKMERTNNTCTTT